MSNSSKYSLNGSRDSRDESPIDVSRDGSRDSFDTDLMDSDHEEGRRDEVRKMMPNSNGIDSKDKGVNGRSRSRSPNQRPSRDHHDHERRSSREERSHMTSPAEQDVKEHRSSPQEHRRSPLLYVGSSNSAFKRLKLENNRDNNQTHHLRR